MAPSAAPSFRSHKLKHSWRISESSYSRSKLEPQPDFDPAAQPIIFVTGLAAEIPGFTGRPQVVIADLNSLLAKSDRDRFRPAHGDSLVLARTTGRIGESHEEHLGVR